MPKLDKKWLLCSQEYFSNKPYYVVIIDILFIKWLFSLNKSTVLPSQSRFDDTINTQQAQDS